MKAYKFVQTLAMVLGVSACQLVGTCKVGKEGDCFSGAYCEDHKGLVPGNNGVCTWRLGTCAVGNEAENSCGKNEECVPNAEGSTKGTCQPLPQPRLTGVQFSSDCRSIELSGEPGIQAPATYASSLGSMDTLCPEGVHGEETGFRCALNATHFVPGTHVARWTVQNSLGEKTNSAAYAFQTVITKAKAMFPMERVRPAAVLGLGAMEGYQVSLSGNPLSSGGCWGGTTLRGSIAAGGWHTCALQANGTVRCWGQDDNNQSTPPGDLSSVVAIIAGYAHTCALQAGGTVRCWGINDKTTFDTRVPPGLSSVAAIAGSWRHTCALQTDGRVRCWGENGHGQASVPENLKPAVAIAAGSRHTCALEAEGTVVCWGNNAAGQTNVPEGLGPVLAIATNWSHTCALQSAGTMVCWGDNAFGQSDVPGNLELLVAIVAGELHTCALQASGTVRCWGIAAGTNYQGQTNVPKDLGPAVAISAGYAHTCVLQADGKVRCWGSNDNDQLVPPLDLKAAVQTVGQLVISPAPEHVPTPSQ